MSLMGWNPDYRYKLLGKLLKSGNDLLFIFDLTTPEIFVKTLAPDGKSKTSHNPTYPAEWKNQFGLPAAQHQNTIQMSIFDGYAVFGIGDTLLLWHNLQKASLQLVMNRQAFSQPTLSIDLKRNCIRIHKKTLHLLGDPEYIQLLVNPSSKLIAICQSISQDYLAHRITPKQLAAKAPSYNAKRRGNLLSYANLYKEKAPRTAKERSAEADSHAKEELKEMAMKTEQLNLFQSSESNKDGI